MSKKKEKDLLLEARSEILQLTTTIQDLKKQLLEDSATGLPNRRYLEARLDEARELSEKYNTTFIFGVFDLDGFKGVNDSSGHSAGDAVMKDIGGILQANVPKTDDIGRWYAGDEFAWIHPLDKLKINSSIITPGKNNEIHEAIGVLDNIRVAIEKGNPYSYTYYVENNKILSPFRKMLPDNVIVTTSIGAVLYDPKRHKDNEMLWHDVEPLLQKSKMTGNKLVAKVGDQTYSLGSFRHVGLQQIVSNTVPAVGAAYKAFNRRLYGKR